ncbi:Zn-ribbon domain-containing OB-fold protein [Nitratireductor sp. ZSWI3]|uniref:Zn-ribbon domain-containing OB-fold protein n=1 Tax=Nitratireductor sp. ZSWI3 TaxID=2966359 RepID=UPI0021501C9E|nr:OB-fold domain-containing protein [Nitratireductor sp. ZSWI3]MCR4265278.1 OB-fold domain-containing protein [Nitratireductor sp. ZSWI3]
MDDQTSTMIAAQGPQATYEAFLAEGRFMIQRARRTGEYVFYPKVMSPSGETELEWVEASGGGTVYAITVNRRREGSYNVALVDLDEGPRMMTTITGVETLPIGARVRARVEPGETPRVVFEPEER